MDSDRRRQRWRMTTIRLQTNDPPIRRSRHCNRRSRRRRDSRPAVGDGEAEEVIRCCVCGRFMSDDDALLGWARDIDMGDRTEQEYAHYDCISEPSK